VAPDDPAIEAAAITFPAESTMIMAYQAVPKGAGPFPLILVCHANRGLTAHFQDFTRRLAKEGYAACAVDLLSRDGGTGSVSDPARIPSLLSGQAAPAGRHVGDFQAALRHYATQPFIHTGAYGMTGFCFGGSITWHTATKTPELKAAAPWYGSAAPAEDARNIKAAMLGIYASEDARVNSTGEAIEPVLKQAHVTYQFNTYPNTRHGFNEETGSGYNQDQALAAWKDLLDWFNRYVRG
jgi:carboxymethylenebutenolidase